MEVINIQTRKKIDEIKEDIKNGVLLKDIIKLKFGSHKKKNTWLEKNHEYFTSEELEHMEFKISEVEILEEVKEDLGEFKVFEKEDEKLTVEISDDRVVSLMYEWKGPDSQLTIAEGNVISSTSNVEKDEEIRKVLNENSTEMLSSYNEVASRMSQEKVLINDVSAMLNIEPNVSHEMNENQFEVTDYCFVMGDNDEVMHAYTLKGGDVVSKLNYSSNVTGDIYTTITDEFIAQADEMVSITSSTQATLTEQKQIFDILNK